MRVIDLEILIALLIVARIVVKYVTLSQEWKNVINEYLDAIIIAGLTALFLISYIIRTFYIPSSSMRPTLVPNDYILVNEFIYRFYEPQRGDIIVFKPPTKKDAPDYIKRVIGMENETLEVKDGKVFINGVPLKEDYIPPEQAPDYEYGPKKIPEGNLFVMGDNRNNSEDSHAWGFLPKKNIVGKAFIIFWPPGRMGLLK
ncbi:MAG TPA: signal peptidase I [Candidatus Eremiobacteraeota bacterium]|nr:signal peptidase I [Candidatus Eremiobacteraeota bacterium]